MNPMTCTIQDFLQLDSSKLACYAASYKPLSHLTLVAFGMSNVRWNLDLHANSTSTNQSTISTIHINAMSKLLVFLIVVFKGQHWNWEF